MAVKGSLVEGAVKKVIAGAQVKFALHVLTLAGNGLCFEDVELFPAGKSNKVADLFACCLEKSDVLQRGRDRSPLEIYQRLGIRQLESLGTLSALWKLESSLEHGQVSTDR